MTTASNNADTPTTAFELGKRDYWVPRGLKDNPYRKDIDLWGYWRDGWKEARANHNMQKYVTASRDQSKSN